MFTKIFNLLPRWRLRYRLIFVVGMLSLNPIFGWDFAQLEESLLKRFGPGPMPMFRDWKQLIGENRALADLEKLRLTNDFFNRRIAFTDDVIVWGVPDYWATPLEIMGKGRGDCEDYSIAKYYALIEMGVPLAKLRLVYVKANQGGVQQAHMVLAYYATPGADPQILDNLNPRIQPASSRPDLSPIFSFNSAGLWQGTGNQTSKSNLSRWQDLLQRAREEGFK